MVEQTNYCVCGVRIYIDENYFKTLKDTHKGFYCVNGHNQSFVSKNEVEEQKEINKIIKEESNNRIAELKREISSAIRRWEDRATINFNIVFLTNKKGFKIDFEIKYRDEKRSVNLTIDETVLKTIPEK